MATLVSQMTTEELTVMIETIIERKFNELFGDPDADLELQDWVIERLRKQRKNVEAGERGKSLDEVARLLELN